MTTVVQVAFSYTHRHRTPPPVGRSIIQSLPPEAYSWVQRLLPAYLQATAARGRQVERSLHCDHDLHMTQRPTHGHTLYGGGGAYTR